MTISRFLPLKGSNIPDNLSVSFPPLEISRWRPHFLLPLNEAGFGHTLVLELPFDMFLCWIYYFNRVPSFCLFIWSILFTNSLKREQGEKTDNDEISCSDNAWKLVASFVLVHRSRRHGETCEATLRCSPGRNKKYPHMNLFLHDSSFPATSQLYFFLKWQSGDMKILPDT